MTELREQPLIASAPINWGVIEVPDWGMQLGRDRVLREMRELGITATEFGPEGFLPDAPVARAETLAAAGLRAVGGFFPAVLHRSATPGDPHDPLPAIERELEAYVAAGAATLVLSAVTGASGYDGVATLTGTEWDALLANLDRAQDAAAAVGVTATLHPHLGTLVESPEATERVLAGSKIGLCLDTGHFTLGGGDPVALVRDHADRIVHAHLKDVSVAVAARVRAGEIDYREGVRQGMYRALGEGDARITEILDALRRAGYRGWYVLEQDTVVESEADAQRAYDSARRSVDFLRAHLIGGGDITAPLRIGVLGASRIAEPAIIDAAGATGDVLAAVAARDPDRAAQFTTRHGFERVHESYEALVGDSSLDLVYIGLPNALHAEWTVRALDAGRSVLVEKPFASNLAEFDRVAKRLETSGGFASEAFHYADHPAVSRLIEIARSGEIGDVERIEVHMEMPAPPANDPRWSFDLAGGALMDVGCYAVNALLLLGEAFGGSLTLLEASADVAESDPRVDAAIVAEFSLGDVPATMHTSMRHDRDDFSLRVIGSDGEATLVNFVKPQEDDLLLVQLRPRGDWGQRALQVREERVGTTSSYVYQLRRMRDAVRTERPPQTDLARSRKTIALIDDIYTACGLPLRPGRLA